MTRWQRAAATWLRGLGPEALCALHGKLGKRGIGHAWIPRLLRLAAIPCAICSVIGVSVATPLNATMATDGPLPSSQLVAVTDHVAKPLHRGCTDVTLANLASGAVLARPRTSYADGPSVGQVAVNSKGSVVVWNSNNNHWFVRVLTWHSEDSSWRDGVFTEGWMAPTGGAVAISPDDETLLVAAENSVWKYEMKNVSARGLGPAVKLAIDPAARAPGNFLHSIVAAAIEFTADSRTAYVVVNDGFIYTLDVDAMAWRHERVPYDVSAEPLSHRSRRTFAALSPDERWLVINRGKMRTGANGLTGELNFVDLELMTSDLVIAPGLKETWGIDFNHFGENRGLLAVHGREAVSVYEVGEASLSQVALARVPAPSEQSWPSDKRWQARFASLAWGGDGVRIIANQGGKQEWRVFELTSANPRQLSTAATFESCVYNGTDASFGPQGFDVVAIQKRPTHTATPLPSLTPTMTPSPQASATPTATQTKTATLPATATASATPTNTASRAPLFLPLALSESCDPVHQRADIALVIDTSSSMAGQKIVDARDAALAFVGMIDLAPGRSQVAVVRFDREADVMRELTNARALIEAAIRNLQVRSGTHIDKGLRAALSELQSARHLERNTTVLILLTDGIQTGTPGEELRAAAEVHAAGARVYAIGLGSDVDEATLRTIAGADDRYYFAPDSGDLARIYSEIARDLMCPGVDLWGGR